MGTYLSWSGLGRITKVAHIPADAGATVPTSGPAMAATMKSARFRRTVPLDGTPGRCTLREGIHIETPGLTHCGLPTEQWLAPAQAGQGTSPTRRTNCRALSSPWWPKAIARYARERDTRRPLAAGFAWSAGPICLVPENPRGEDETVLLVALADPRASRSTGTMSRCVSSRGDKSRQCRRSRPTSFDCFGDPGERPVLGWYTGAVDVLPPRDQQQ